jgi:hypothetical protein
MVLLPKSFLLQTVRFSSTITPDMYLFCEIGFSVFDNNR